MSLWWEIPGLLLFALASFFFALAESALFALSKWQRRQLLEHAPGAGAQVDRLLAQPRDLLATLVLGNALSTGALIAVTLWTVFSLGWPIWPQLAVVLGLFGLVLIGCEVFPKTLAVRAPERWSAWVAGPLVVLQRLTRPLRRVGEVLSGVMLKVLVPASAQPQNLLSDEEYRELLELAYQRGTIAEAEKEIILQILRLDRRTARDVMKPRAQMACLSDELTVEEMIAAARRFGHRRLPLYDETPDTIVGVLNTRTLLLDPTVDLAEAIELPSFVPESMNLLQLLTSLQRQRRGLAIVLDEFGSTAGLVTLEDLLEEMIGALRGEGQDTGLVVEKLAEGRWRLNAAIRIDDFRREYPELGDVAEVETLGGLLMAQLQVVPAVGDSAVYRGLRLTATVADERRVRELLVEVIHRRGGR